MIETLNARTQRLIEPEPNSGCWIWTGHRNDRGYGSSGSSGKTHRSIYERLIAPVPEGMELDHVCRNRACVNPKHLEPVSHQENVLRGISPLAIQAQQTHCKRGHALTPDNLTAKKNGRECRQCANERARGWRPAMSHREAGRLGAHSRWTKEKEPCCERS